MPPPLQKTPKSYTLLRGFWGAGQTGTEHQEQRTTTGSSGNVTYHTKYYLDWLGNVTQLNYPSVTGATTVNYTFDSAGRPSLAVDSANGITYAQGTCANGIASNGVCYAPNGSVASESIGVTSSFTGIGVVDQYNNRFQPLEIHASSSGGNAFDISYNFVDPSSQGNAGHVYSITNNIDGTRSQTFTYDQLNRVASALTTSTHATSPTHCWGEVYGLDPWANLQSIAATTNSAYTGCSEESGFAKSADGNNHLAGFTYDASGNTSNDSVYTNYMWNGESQLKSAGGVAYLYDGDGRRVAKIGSKLYWYASDNNILIETNSTGAILNQYVYFGGKRVALLPAGSTAQFYAEDFLGTSRVVTTNAGAVCYDADFYPYGGERTYTNSCTQNNYKFEGKERDTETGNDDFGARYYTNRFGRWLSADWSSTPIAVPYANLTNPQTLNLYAMVADDPESFADLNGHGPPDEDNEEEDREEDTELDQIHEALRQVEARQAKELLDAHQAWVATQTKGYDDPLTGACYAPPAGPNDRTANDELRRDANGNPIPDPNAKGAAHTQMGTRTSKSQTGSPTYRQGMEYDENGKPVRRIDHTNHGRKDHPNPHQHMIDPNTGKIGPPQPMPPPPTPPPPPPPPPHAPTTSTSDGQGN